MLGLVEEVNFLHKIGSKVIMVLAYCMYAKSMLQSICLAVTVCNC